MDLTQVPDGCEEVLTQLSQRYFLAVVTSRHRLGIEHFYATSGLEGLLSVSIAFEDYDSPKPAPDPLLTACRRLGVSPEEAVYVGDAEVDVLCAAAAGMGFIAYGPVIKEAPLRALSFADIPGTDKRALVGPLGGMATGSRGKGYDHRSASSSRPGERPLAVRRSESSTLAAPSGACSAATSATGFSSASLTATALT